MQWYESGSASGGGSYYYYYNSNINSSSSNSSSSSNNNNNNNNNNSYIEEESGMEKVERLASENAVVVFSVASCCMCHVLKRLFCSLGVHVTVYELDSEDGQEGGSGGGSGHAELKEALDAMFQSSSSLSSSLSSPSSVLPAVFIGGKLIGGIERVMAAHISGTLVPLLREAGALWL